MTSCSRGDVVLVGFMFADESGVKKRPAVVISSDEYNRGRHEAIISAITSRTDRVLAGDCLLGGWKDAGLLFPSVATGVIRTIKQDMVARTLGRMPDGDMKGIEKELRAALGLGKR